jgi:hypothetical protein
VKRGAFARMKRIYGWLQDGRYPNCTSIARDLEVSVKTAARDIDCMRASEACRLITMTSDTGLFYGSKRCVARQFTIGRSLNGRLNISRYDQCQTPQLGRASAVAVERREEPWPYGFVPKDHGMKSCRSQARERACKAAWPALAYSPSSWSSSPPTRTPITACAKWWAVVSKYKPATSRWSLIPIHSVPAEAGRLSSTVTNLP